MAGDSLGSGKERTEAVTVPCRESARQLRSILCSEISATENYVKTEPSR